MKMIDQLPVATASSSFQTLWQRNLLDKVVDESASIHQDLIQAYLEPQRIYHEINHIETCLILFDEIKHMLDNPDALALAIWFHDAIYAPGAGDNEQLSADWFMSLSQKRLDDELRQQVFAHIMATLHCGSDIENHDSRIMVDIDLSSFGMSWPVFLNDSKHVREERPDLSDADFYHSQIVFLNRLAERPRFFQSDYFFEHYEKQARENLSRFMSLIESRYLKP